MKEKKEFKPINVISERYCAKLGDNAIIVITETAFGRQEKCLYADRCKKKCECKCEL